MRIKVCIVCGRDFQITHSLIGKRFCCSRKCRGLSQKNGNKVPCNNCGKLVYRPKGHLESLKLTFCSNKCKIDSPVLKEKIRNSHKGITYEERFGKKKAIEMKKNLSIKHKGIPRRKRGIYRNCRICSKSFYVYPSDDRKHNKEVSYCSIKCVGVSRVGKQAWNKGIPHTEKHRRKLKEAKKNEKERPWARFGKHIPCASCGKLIYKCRAHLEAQRNHYCSKECSPIIKRTCSDEVILYAFIKERLTLKSISKKYHIDRESVKQILRENHIRDEDIRNRANEVIGANTKKHRKYQIFPMKDSSIEVRMQQLLKEKGIELSKHKYIEDIEHGYQCDIFIPSLNLVIECDGDYWHNRPYGNELDILRSNELREVGYKLLRFWESEIKVMTSEDLILKIDQVI